MTTLGKIGLWFAHNAMSLADSVALARQVEAYGYGILWIPEAIGRDLFVHLACWRATPRPWSWRPALPTSGPAMR